MSRHTRPVDPNAAPGTDPEYYVEATVHPEDHPRLSEEIETEVDHLEATQFTMFGRTWQCGGEYWDRCLEDLVELDAVVRKSSWCHTGDVEEAPIRFQINPEHHDWIEYDPTLATEDEDRMDPTERFLPRHNVPYTLP